ncbi:MAG: redoxin domain-containing protein [Saprospiraceae bacterium]|nr:redoxin domain-containing protein [Saprospiraceae bacterium]
MGKLKLAIVVFVCVCSIGALRAQTIDSTLIDVTIEGIPPGIARVVGTYGDQNYLADSTMVDDKGHLVLKRKNLLPAGYYFFLLPGQRNFPFLIDKDQRFTLRAKANDLIGTMEVEGSLNTELLYKNLLFQSIQDPELGRLSEIMRKNPPNSAEYLEAKVFQLEMLAGRKTHLEEIYKEFPDALFTSFKRAGQNPDFVEFKKPNGDTDTLRQVLHYRDHFWDGVDFKDTRLLYTPVIVNKLKRYIKELTPQNPDSLVKVSDQIIRRVMPYKDYFRFFSNWIALQHENTKTTVMDGEAVYVHIVKTFFTDELATWDTPENLAKLRLHVSEMEASLLGRKGPDVRAMDVNGEYKSIYELTAPIVVIFMFSPDCEHCQKEAPEIERLYKKWKPRGVEFFGISISTTDAEWKAFVKKNGFTFTNVFDPTNRAIYAKYFVDITPELYVLNKDRTIVAKNLKSEQLETIFERELRKLK